jgi:hypothetical protein
VDLVEGLRPDLSPADLRLAVLGVQRVALVLRRVRQKDLACLLSVPLSAGDA